MTTPAQIQASEFCTSAEQGSKQLLPGIPDEVTLHNIAPKLPWKAFHILSSVSRAWLHGIRSRQVYDARVLSQSTETLALVSLGLGSNWTTGALMSLREKRARTKLPSIKYHGGQWVCSGGLIYLLGVKTSFGADCGNKVFVFDVAGQRQWKECASMNEPRTQFGCRIMHGKVYVFGGVSISASRPGAYNPSIFCGSEVYDPKEDRWFPIRPMKSLRVLHKVEIVGDELFVHDGSFFDRKIKNDKENPIDNCRSDDEGHLRVANFLEVYHPVKDEWRVVNPFGRTNEEYLFGGAGKFYSINFSSIHVYSGENSWSPLHSLSFSTCAPSDFVRGKILSATFIDGELLIEASWEELIAGRENYNWHQFQTKGFGGDSHEITREEASPFSNWHTSYPESSNALIQL